MHRIFFLILISTLSFFVQSENKKSKWYGIYTTDRLIDYDCEITGAQYLSMHRWAAHIDYQDDTFENMLGKVSDLLESDMVNKAKSGRWNAIVDYNESIEFSFDSNLEGGQTYTMNGRRYHGDGVALFKARGMRVVVNCD